MRRLVQLEPAAEAVCDAAAIPPRIYQMPVDKARATLEKMQDMPVYLYSAKIEKRQMDTGGWGRIPVYLVIPPERKKVSPVIFYIHGAGWVLGSFHTHEKLVRELAARTGCIVVFPEYSRAPEAHYPVAIEQCYSILCRVKQLTAQAGYEIQPETLTVAGDSVGGNMAAAMTLLSKYRQGPFIHKQLLYYPVTNACFNTNSYIEFAENYYLYREGMIWFWNQYTMSRQARMEITASPLKAEREQLTGLPQAMILNGQADVLRDEGECYANHLRAAGVEVTALRFQAIIHDFVMLNALDETCACRAAMDASTQWIQRRNSRALVVV